MLIKENVENTEKQIEHTYGLCHTTSIQKYIYIAIKTVAYIHRFLYSINVFDHIFIQIH